MKSKFLMVMSILALIFGIIGLIGIINSLMTYGSLSAYTGIKIPIAGNILGLVNDIIMTVAGVIGIRVSNKPYKAGSGVVWGVILLIMSVITLIVSMLEFGTIAAAVEDIISSLYGFGIDISGMSWMNCIGLIIPVLYLIAAIRFKTRSGSYR